MGDLPHEEEVRMWWEACSIPDRGSSILSGGGRSWCVGDTEGSAPCSSMLRLWSMVCEEGSKRGTPLQPSGSLKTAVNRMEPEACQAQDTF